MGGGLRIDILDDLRTTNKQTHPRTAKGTLDGPSIAYPGQYQRNQSHAVGLNAESFVALSPPHKHGEPRSVFRFFRLQGLWPNWSRGGRTPSLGRAG